MLLNDPGFAAEYEYWRVIYAAARESGRRSFLWGQQPTYNGVGLFEAFGPDTTILDVGSGPVSPLRGKVTQVDILGDEYNAMLQGFGLPVPSDSHGISGEHMLDHFGGQRFDIVTAFNSLDHSVNPLGILEQMKVLALKLIYLEHYQYAGWMNDYSGLHQWNCDIEMVGGKHGVVFSSRDGMAIDVNGTLEMLPEILEIRRLRGNVVIKAVYRK